MKKMQRPHAGCLRRSQRGGNSHKTRGAATTEESLVPMKPAILLLALLSPITAWAQTPAPTMTDKVCDQRGKIYVTDKNKDEPVPEHGRSFYWSFVAAHYDRRTNSCYVMYDRFVSVSGTVALEQIKIDDIEGNRVAGYGGLQTSNRTSRPKPSECEVNGTNCESKSEFDELLGTFIPAFRKTNSTLRVPYEKNCEA